MVPAPGLSSSYLPLAKVAKVTVLKDPPMCSRVTYSKEALNKVAPTEYMDGKERIYPLPLATPFRFILFCHCNHKRPEGCALLKSVIQNLMLGN